MRILGIDPGSRNCGLAIIDTEPFRLREVGSIILPGVGGEALQRWRIELDDWIARWQPERIAIESVFFNRNVSSAVKVGEARGIVMLVGYEHGCPVISYTPQQAKKAITGSGNADKHQVAAGLIHAGFRDTKNQHANDAAAIAVCDAISDGHITLEYQPMIPTVKKSKKAVTEKTAAKKPAAKKPTTKKTTKKTAAAQKENDAQPVDADNSDLQSVDSLPTKKPRVSRKKT